MRSEHDANLSLVPIKRTTWADPSRCHRPVRSKRAGWLVLIPLAVALVAVAVHLGV